MALELDLQETSQNYDKALALAIKEKETALPLVKANPKSRDTKQLAYDATIRLGALFSSQKFQRFDEALREFEGAKGVAQDIVALSGDEASEVDLVNAELKIGDIPHIRGQENDALTDYRAALSECEKALGKFPQSNALLQYKANTYYRIAEAERAAGSLEEAKSAYQSAMNDPADAGSAQPRRPRPEIEPCRNLLPTGGAGGKGRGPRRRAVGLPVRRQAGRRAARRRPDKSAMGNVSRAALPNDRRHPPSVDSANGRLGLL